MRDVAFCKLMVREQSTYYQL